jgi:4-hydroxy 2-oxovalerate aldolase
MAASSVEFAEISFRSLETKTFKGACAYSCDSFIKNLQIPNSLKIGVMVNASELLNYKTKNPIQNQK